MKLDKIEFQIKHIDILEFSFKNPRRVFPENSPFRFDLQSTISVNEQEGRIDVNSKYKIFYDNETEYIANAEVSCIYHVLELDKLVSEPEDKGLPKEFITTLNSISISTSRGVLFALFRGTPLHSVILPIVNPGEHQHEN